ncbi:MAG: Ig-like domain-containing protein [Candidatus Moraniibacteriota bacterium]
MKKSTSWGLISGFLLLVLGLVVLNPTIAEEKKHKTIAFDKQLKTKEDFSKGKFKDIKLKEKNKGAQLEVESGETGEYTTPVVEAPFKATHLGVHWKSKKGQEDFIRVQIRTGNSKDALGDWMEVETMDGEGKNGEKSEKEFAHLASVGENKFAQAKVVFEGNNEKSLKLNQFEFTFINSKQTEKESKKFTFAPRITAETFGFNKTSPHGQEINVISREEWGADESYRETPSGEEDWPRSYHGTRKIILHHTANAGSNGVTSIDDNMDTMRSMYYYHAVTRGWGDLGYNAVVDAAGNVYEGRYGTPGEDFKRTSPTAEDVMALDVEGAHASSYNSGTFGVSAMGDFTDFDLPAAQKEGLEDVMAYVADERGINVQGYSDFLNYQGEWREKLNNVIAHRDVAPTACPGDHFYAQITDMKTSVDNRAEMPHNLDNFSATFDGTDIEGQAIGYGDVLVEWSDFSGAAGYEYALEKVFGTIYDPQPYETAWMNSNNIKSTTASEATIDTSLLDTNSQYALYVRAVDTAGAPISTVEHVNFQTDELTKPDTVSPTVSIINPDDEYKTEERERIEIYSEASDNVKVAKMELFFNDKLLETCDNTTNCSGKVFMFKEEAGEHLVKAKAYDEAGNTADHTITIIKPGETSEESDETAPEISIISPSEGDEVSGTIEISADATDNVGVDKVDFLVNDSIIKSDSSLPFSASWDTTGMEDGQATIFAKAYDEAGNIGTSDSVNVTVANNSELDTEVPTVPKNLSAQAVSESQVDLNWDSSTDNTGVAGYNIYRDGSKVASSEATNFSDTGLSPSTKYTYQVSAYDSAENESNLSESAYATTPASSSINEAPVVTINSPTDGEELFGVVKINATADDPDGTVENMKVYVDGNWMVTKDKDTIEYNFNTRKVSHGEHTIQVTAEDEKGEVGSSQVNFIGGK